MSFNTKLRNKNCLVWDFHFQFTKELQFRISQRNWVEVDSGKKRHALMIQSNWSIFQNDFIHKRMTGNIECVFYIKSNSRRCDIVQKFITVNRGRVIENKN